MPQPVESGLVLYLPFDERSGITAWDRMRFRNHGTLTGATHLPVWVAGHRKGVLSFDGVDDYVSVADSLSLRIGSQITLTAWIQPQNVVGNKDVVAKWRSVALQRSYYLGLVGNTVTFSLRKSDDSAAVTVTSALTVSTSWVFIVGSWDGATMRIYVNGVLDVNTGAIATAQVNTVWLGVGLYYGSPQYFKGNINEVRIYNRALTAGEVKRLYESGMLYAKYA